MISKLTLSVTGDLNGRRAHLQGMAPVAPGKTTVKATVPMESLLRFALDLRSIKKGRGRFRAAMSHYDELPHSEADTLIKTYESSKKGDEDH